jgi:hypothetical protein
MSYFDIFMLPIWLWLIGCLGLWAWVISVIVWNGMQWSRQTREVSWNEQQRPGLETQLAELSEVGLTSTKNFFGGRSCQSRS